MYDAINKLISEYYSLLLNNQFSEAEKIWLLPKDYLEKISIARFKTTSPISIFQITICQHKSGEILSECFVFYERKNIKFNVTKNVLLKYRLILKQKDWKIFDVQVMRTLCDYTPFNDDKLQLIFTHNLALIDNLVEDCLGIFDLEI